MDSVGHLAAVKYLEDQAWIVGWLRIKLGLLVGWY
jgi:hypothetical protein